MAEDVVVLKLNALFCEVGFQAFGMPKIVRDALDSAKQVSLATFQLLADH
jgi:hypothetical protein